MADENWLQSIWRHYNIVLGGGALAVAVEFVPESWAYQGHLAAAIFLGGLLLASYLAWLDERDRALRAERELQALRTESPSIVINLEKEGRIAVVRITNNGTKAAFTASIDATGATPKSVYKIAPAIWESSAKAVVTLAKGVSSRVVLAQLVETHERPTDPNDHVFVSYSWRIGHWCGDDHATWEIPSSSRLDDANFGSFTLQLVSDPPMADGALRMRFKMRGNRIIDDSSSQSVSFDTWRKIRLDQGQFDDERLH